MARRRGILIALGVAVAAAIVLLLFLLRGGEKQASGQADTPDKKAPERRIAPVPETPPQTPKERDRYARRMEQEPPPETPPEEEQQGEPPPLTALILTFPDGTKDEEIQALYQKCGLKELRRSGNYARVTWGDGDPAEAKNCLRWSIANVSDERGGPANR